MVDVDEFVIYFIFEYGNDVEEKILEEFNEIVLFKINSKFCVC